MGKTVKPLNDTLIKSSKPKEDDYTLSDGNVLYLLIKKNGSKIWRFNYINPISNKRTLVNFGSYPEVTLQLARQKRDEYSSLVSQGVDPQEQKKIKIKQAINENQNTFQKVADKWIELQTTKGFTTKTINTIEVME